MEDFQKWVCIHTANSLLEANMLRAILENHGIPVTICSAPGTQLHDYLHDKFERVRIFIPESQTEVGQHYRDDFVAMHQAEVEFTS